MTLARICLALSLVAACATDDEPEDTGSGWGIDVFTMTMHPGESTYAASSIVGTSPGEPAYPATATWTTDNFAVLHLSATTGSMVMITAGDVGTAHVIARHGDEMSMRTIEVVAP